MVGQRVVAAVIAGLVGAVVSLLPGRPAVAATDVTAAITANKDVTLAGDAVVRLAGGTTTYTGVLSGAGTFTVAGTGRLVLTRDSDFTLPAGQQRQRLVTYHGNHPITRLDDPDPPAVIVARGATLQYGTGSGTTGAIRHDLSAPGVRWNALNTRVDGVLDVAVAAGVHLGILSGTGLVTARRFVWPGLSLAGRSPFSGTLVNGTGFDYGSNSYVSSFPNIRTIVNYGSAIHGAADGEVTLDPANYWSKAYGGDINYHTWGSGLVQNTGVYSFSDNASETDPTLSSPALNWLPLAHDVNKRGINLEGATVEWGDGTTRRFFAPGNEQTLYVNLHSDGRDRSKLILNYDGPVTLGVPISGGRYHDTLAAVGQGDVVIAATRGNAVTFSAPQNYDGSTTIGRGASLRLGDGTGGGDSALLRSGLSQVIDNGALIVQNTVKGASLSKISGPGTLTQAGAAATTLTGAITYRGATTVSLGTLRLTGGTLARSSGVNLTRPGATLDLTAAGDQTLTDLTGVAGTTVRVGRSLTLGTDGTTTFAGSLVGVGAVSLTKTGNGTLNLSGATVTPHATWTIEHGRLALGTATASVQATVSVARGGALASVGKVDGTLTNAGVVSASRGRVSGDYVQRPGARLTTVEPGKTLLTVAGTVTLAGKLALSQADVLDTGKLTLVENAGSRPVTGTFEGLPEGAKVGAREISYRGGDGNDVVLASAVRPVSGKPGTPLPAALGGSGQRWLGPGLGLLAAALAAGLLVVRRFRRRSAARRRSHASP